MSDASYAQSPPNAARIPYGAHPVQFGDLRLPSTTGPHPVAVMIHGGFWQARYDLEHLGDICAALTAQGIATWSIEYRRIGHEGGGWPGTFHDVGSAVDFLRTLATSHQLDLNRLAAVGHSAGGHLALWAAGRGRLPSTSELYAADPLPIPAVVSLAGVADLTAAWALRLNQRVVAALLEGGPDDVPTRYAESSPAALLPLGVRQIAIHGTKDGPVPFQISADYVAQAQAAGDQAELIALEGTRHFELIDPNSREWPIIASAICKLVAT